MASLQTYLDLISQYESGNANVVNYRYGPKYTAQGYYQITNTNWGRIAPILGIDTSVYPDAMSAPKEVQAQVAGYLLTQTPAGVSNWSRYNPNLLSALDAAGLQTSGAVSDSPLLATGGGPLIDLSGPAATASTNDILDALAAGDFSSMASFIDPATGGEDTTLLILGAVGLALVAAFVS